LAVSPRFEGLKRRKQIGVKKNAEVIKDVTELINE